ncbi:polysaccharide pyruvyl transferase family protein [Cohnella zeiphila]|uniref:Polysaccharide pyruvyl transferase family protein n=1 Tax=Cohnella zeiphila TaxID=2761120 RepID=A0A7X0SKQ2_9BACL|nr:polysaccharide pyruvyl transferase family protein [Cohnella zeiphila]MBB6731772.1 polysaccharide pyruvyl transferase family protein [Cohnella zeiphila]
MTRTVLYVGWIGFNNFGDELMRGLFEQLASDRLPPDRYGIVPAVPGVETDDLGPYDTVVLGGGSLLIAGYADLLWRAAQEGKRILVWGSGYDCIHLAKTAGGGVTLPDSIREAPEYRKRLRDLAEAASFFVVRGPWTRDYLLHQGVPPELVRVSGDPGLLAAVDREEAEAGRSGGTGTLGVNWGTVYDRMYGANESEVEDALAQVCREWIERGWRIHLYVVWGPDRKSAERLHAKIGKAAQTTLDLKLYDTPGYYNLVRGFDATLNLKLHANVISAAAGVPFVSLGYRFKCFDFVHSAGVPELIVPTSAPHLADRLNETLRAALHSGDEWREKLAAKREEARLLLTEPFEGGLL